MAGSAAVDDKRADDRRIKELRDFQRSNPANKRCFDCNEMMPQYVCVDFNTFVCTSCSGIHREFGHRVKSISMAKFTDTEVKNMLKFGGNEAAQKIWRAKHDANFRPSGGSDGERTRNFIRLTYIDKKWQYESPRPGARDDQPQSRTASGGAKKATASSGDDFFSSSSSSKAAPSFDAFSDPTPASNNGGFGAFGDFSSFDKPKKQQNDFDDFGRFDSPTSTSSQSMSGFGDFGGFSSKPAAAPPLRDEFKTGSFTLAPPPGSDFGAFGAAPAPVAVAAPSTQTKTASGGNDFLAFSPVNNKPATNDPFGFANSPVASAKTNSQKAATPFDAFGSPVGANSNRSSFDAFGAPASTGSRSASSSFDAFGAATQPAPASPFGAFGAATPSTPAPAFDAFGSPPTPTPPAPAFDAFGSASKPAAPASPGFGAFGSPTPAFDAFGAAPAASKTSSGSSFGAFGASSGQGVASFDAFGSAASPASSGFGAFGAAPGSSSSRTNSATPSDPFSGFSPRTSSGTKAPEPPKAEAADPFSAFDAVESSGLTPVPASMPSAPTGSAYDAFGSAHTTPTPSVGQAPSPFGQAPQGQMPSPFGQASQGQNHGATNADPFAFAGAGAKTGSFSSNGMGAPTKTNSFSNAAPGSQPGFGGPTAFGGFPQGPQPGAFGQQPAQGQGFPPQQHPQFQQQQQMYSQQQPQSHFGQFPAQGYAGQPGMPPQQQQQQQQQQQWMHPNGAAYGSQFPPQQGHPNQSGPSAQPTPPAAAAPAPAPPKADVSSLKDPFASLGLGSLGVSGTAPTSNSNPSSRGNSFAKPAASPATSATSSFTNAAPIQHTGGQSPFGASMGFGMGAAPLSSGGSRGNSFETPKSHFAASSGSTTASPMASFSMPAMGAPTPAPSFGASSPSPVASFSLPGGQTTPQKQSSFGDANAFGAFPSPARADSMKQQAPPAASSNPFDMF